MRACQADSPAFFKPFDSAKAAKREFGLLIELTELLRMQQLPWIPVAVERYIYVSRYKRRPFRMRTYFFRFGQQNASSSEFAFAQAWVNSKTFFANDEAFTEVKMPVVSITVPPTTKGIVTHMEQTTPKLIDLSGYVAVPKPEYDQLLADSQQLRAIRSALEGAMVSNTHPAQPSSTSPPSVEPQGNKAGRVRKSWDSFTACEQIDFTIKALELRLALGGKFTGTEGTAAWEKLLKGTFGYYNPKLGRSTRATLARTSGEKFRPEFEERIRKACGDKASLTSTASPSCNASSSKSFVAGVPSGLLFFYLPIFRP